jgi:hypothetical protein
MANPVRPSSTPAWTQGNTGQQVEPTTGEKFAGYVPNQRPAPKKLNWVLGNVSDWIDWLDYITAVNYSVTAFDAVVGVNGTHATINDLMADSNIANIYSVLVTSPQTLTATQVINKSDISFVFKPSAVYSKGTTTTPGISITAQRVRITGGRFTSFNGVSDVAILLTNISKNNLITDCFFADNTTPINDLGSNNTYANNIQEV